MTEDNKRGQMYTPREATISPRSRRKRARALVRSHSQYDVRTDVSPPPSDQIELSIDYRAPGLLKIFGESVVAGARYKSVLASTRSTAQELIKQALERYGLPCRLHRDFVLCESVGRAEPSADDEGARDSTTEEQGTRRKHDSERRKNRNRSSSPPLSSPAALLSSLVLKSKNSNTSPRTPRSARSLPGRKSKRKKEKSSTRGVTSLQALCDSPRTPLGSPRTPCGSPSTSRGSPRASLNQGKAGSNHDDEVLQYRAPRVLDTSRTTVQLADIYRPRGERSSRHFPNISSGTVSPRVIHNDLKNEDGTKAGRRELTPSAGQSGHEDTPDNEGENSGWFQVYLRVLSYSDRPLELQDFWKPPEGLSRRFELRRRCDVTMSANDDDTLGINDNARKIMMSKVSPGVIPQAECVEDANQRRVTLREEWEKASLMTNATLSYTSPRDQSLTNIVDGDPRQAYVCPSIYPYLLTLRGCSIQKDLVLYPLKSRSLCIGSGEKKSQSDDIRLCSDDVSTLHCRVMLKRLPQAGETPITQDKRIYWYCLDLDIYRSSYVTVNGIQVKQKATVLPGDLLGIGRQYLFLYKDPTGGHDIPSAVPWFPDSSASHTIAHGNSRLEDQYASRYIHAGLSSLALHQDQRRRSDDITSQDGDDDMAQMDDSTLRNAALFLAYHRDKEVELLESISEVKAFSKEDYPLSLAVLYMAAHHYAARKFSGDHQITFFKRLVRVVKAKVGTISKSLSHQKQASAILNPDNSFSQSATDHFPELVTWLSNVMALLCHFRTPQFQTHVISLAHHADVTTALQDTVSSLEDTVNLLFQQTVYSVTKVLYEKINILMHNASPDNVLKSPSPIRQVVEILQRTMALASDLQLHEGVTAQLMTYLLFFISTTFFNRIIAKGSKLYSRDAGTKLQEDVSTLEKWAKSVGLEAEFVRVSEHLMSLTDLLASSKRSLTKLNWESFHRQFSPLTDGQLWKVLSEYSLGEGALLPSEWSPPYPVDTKTDLTLSLSSHPQFLIPKQGPEISLSDSFPPCFFRHLEKLQQRFSLVGEDACYSGMSSAGNTPRLSDSMNRPTNLATFFSQESLSLPTSVPPGHHPAPHQVPPDEMANRVKLKHRSQMTKPPPPPPPPKPNTQPSSPAAHLQGHGKDACQKQHPPGPPPYNLAVRNKRALMNQHNMVGESTDDGRESRHQQQPHQPPGPTVIQNSNWREGVSDQKLRQCQQNEFNFETLPNFHDNISKHNHHSSNQNQSHPNHHHHHHHHHHHNNPQPHITQHKPQPILKTQHSWAHNANIGLFQRRREAQQTADLASSYPLVRPRPSSANDYTQNVDPRSSLEEKDSETPQFMTASQREHFLGRRSNSALGNNSSESSELDYSQQRKREVGRVNHIPPSHDGNTRKHSTQPSNYLHATDVSYKHVNDAQQINNKQYTTSNISHELETADNRRSNSGHFGSLKRSPRNADLSVMPSSETAVKDSSRIRNEDLHSSQGVSGKLPNGLDALSDTHDVPPPLPPKGEFLKRRLSVESQKSVESSRNPVFNRQQSGSRNSVEIQDTAENQYIIYNPDLPVKDIFDHNQNLHGMKDKNAKNQLSSTSKQKGKLIKVPPLELPDDLLGISESESPDDVFNESAENRIKKGCRSNLKRNSVESNSFNYMGANTDVVLPSRMKSGRTNSSSSDKYPDDIYVDVPELRTETRPSSSTSLKVLPLDDGNRAGGEDSDSGNISVRYRHTMPEPRDIVTKGEVTGEVFNVSLDKSGSKLGMGLIDGLHTSLKVPGIYVRNVLPDTPAALCGCIRVGDRILSVNGKSIVGADYRSAMNLIRTTGPRLNLLVAKCDRSVSSMISASNA